MSGFFFNVGHCVPFFKHPAFTFAPPPHSVRIGRSLHTPLRSVFVLVIRAALQSGGAGQSPTAPRNSIPTTSACGFPGRPKRSRTTGPFLCRCTLKQPPKYSGKPRLARRWVSFCAPKGFCIPAPSVALACSGEGGVRAKKASPQGHPPEPPRGRARHSETPGTPLYPELPACVVLSVAFFSETVVTGYYRTIAPRIRSLCDAIGAEEGRCSSLVPCGAKGRQRGSRDMSSNGLSFQKKRNIPFPPVQKERSFVTLGCRIDVNQ